MPEPLTMVLDGVTDLTVTRSFDAPPELVYRAHAEPALVQGWMLGPPGWTMPSCEMDLRPGGSFRWEYARADGSGFAIAGEFLEIEPGQRNVFVQRMLMPEPTPDIRIDTRFEADGAAGTRLVLRMQLADGAGRDALLRTGATEGMELSYRALDRLVVEGD